MALEQARIRGWDVLRLTSDTLSVTLVPALGGCVTSLRCSDGRELLAPTPWGLPYAGSPVLPGDAEAQMLDTSPGGWEPLFPNAGPSVNAYGTEWGFDGEARTTWLEWVQTEASVVLNGRLRRSPFRLSRTLGLTGPTLEIHETVHNLGAESVEVLWGHRLRFGTDLLGPDTVLDTGASVVRSDPEAAGTTSWEDLLPWPRAYAEDGLVNLRGVPGPDAAVTRAAYLSDFDRPWASLTRPATDLSVRLEWQADPWPYLGYALEAGGATGYPWYGSGHHLALTPASSWPMSGLHLARRTSGTTLWIAGGESRTAGLTLRVTAP